MGNTNSSSPKRGIELPASTSGTVPVPPYLIRPTAPPMPPVQALGIESGRKAHLYTYDIKSNMILHVSGKVLNRLSFSALKNFYHDYRGDTHIKPLIGWMIGILVDNIKDTDKMYEPGTANPKGKHVVEYNYPTCFSSYHGSDMWKKTFDYADTFNWAAGGSAITLFIKVEGKRTRSDCLDISEACMRISDITKESLGLRGGTSLDDPISIVSPSQVVLRPSFN